MSAKGFCVGGRGVWENNNNDKIILELYGLLRLTFIQLQRQKYILVRVDSSYMRTVRHNGLQGSLGPLGLIGGPRGPMGPLEDQRAFLSDHLMFLLMNGVNKLLVLFIRVIAAGAFLFSPKKGVSLKTTIFLRLRGAAGFFFV